MEEKKSNERPFWLKEFAKNHPAFLVSLSYIFLSVLSFIANYRYYQRYEIDYAQFVEVNDLLFGVLKLGEDSVILFVIAFFVFLINIFIFRQRLRNAQKEHKTFRDSATEEFQRQIANQSLRASKRKKLEDDYHREIHNQNEINVQRESKILKLHSIMIAVIFLVAFSIASYQILAPSNKINPVVAIEYSRKVDDIIRDTLIYLGSSDKYHFMIDTCRIDNHEIYCPVIVLSSTTKSMYFYENAINLDEVNLREVIPYTYAIQVDTTNSSSSTITSSEN